MTYLLKDIALAHEYVTPDTEPESPNKKIIMQKQIKCVKCNSLMLPKSGKFGEFLACTNYPNCKHTQQIEIDEETREEQEQELKALQKQFENHRCYKCNALMNVKQGPFGFFLGCSKYPICNNIQNIKISSGVNCPKCKTGDLIERHTKTNTRLFWGCDNYPKCKFSTWYKPMFINQNTKKLMVEDKYGNIMQNPKQKKPLKKD